MATLREKIEGFIYPFYERFTDLCYKGGEDTEFLGVRLLDDASRFTHGALVNAAATLYQYYAKTQDARRGEVLKRLHLFIKLAAENVCKTWGKIAILRAFCTLDDAGLIDDIDPEYTALVKEKTNYEDFFDKERLDTRGMATNYMQVAMACAAMRERLGWENEGYSKRIMEKLSSILLTTASDGWLDDEIPYGRFDRYSLVLSSEFADTARIARLDVPDFIKKNIRRSAEIMLFSANSKGDCIPYGRSVAIHGDSTAAEVLSTAIAEGLLNEEECRTAITYMMAIYDKKLSFWYDEGVGAFNMWWGGRGHDSYRPIDRILETNLDAANHMYMQLKNLTEGGVADIEIDGAIDSSSKWESKFIRFRSMDDDERSLMILKRNGQLVMIPFVAFGSHFGNHSAYYPFPAFSGGILESSPRAEFPFFVPEYTDEDGKKYRPVQYFNKVDHTCENGNIELTATGYLAIIDGTDAHRSDIKFEIKYKIKENTINVAINIGRNMVCAEMYTSEKSDHISVLAKGFDDFCNVQTGGELKYLGTHGEIENVKIHTKKLPSELGYEIVIK